MTARRYAEGTSVPVNQTREEIETVLERYGATASRITKGLKAVIVEFIAHERAVRFHLTLPDASDRQFAKTPKQRTARSPQAAQRAWEGECKRLWRALLNSIKAKLEAVQSGIATFEEEFLSYTIDPQTGRTVAEAALPAIAKAYEQSGPPQLTYEPSQLAEMD